MEVVVFPPVARILGARDQQKWKKADRQTGEPAPAKA